MLKNWSRKRPKMLRVGRHWLIGVLFNCTHTIIAFNKVLNINNGVLIIKLMGFQYHRPSVAIQNLSVRSSGWERVKLSKQFHMNMKILKYAARQSSQRSFKKENSNEVTNG